MRTKNYEIMQEYESPEKAQRRIKGQIKEEIQKSREVINLEGLKWKPTQNDKLKLSLLQRKSFERKDQISQERQKSLENAKKSQSVERWTSKVYPFLLVMILASKIVNPNRSRVAVVRANIPPLSLL